LNIVGISQGLEGLGPISHGARRSGKMRLLAERYAAPGVSNLFTVSPDDKSQAILAVARTRDRESFRVLFLHFAPRVKSYLIKHGTQALLADELAQETLLTVWRKAESFDPLRASASTWIFTIARNLRIDMMRRSARRDIPADYAEDALAVPSPGDEYLSSERNQKLAEALKNLPQDQADVVRLSFFEEKPHPEIAAQLGIPLGTVKSRLRLAMNRLRNVLEEVQ